MLFAVGCAALGLLLALPFPPTNARVKPKPNPKPLPSFCNASLGAQAFQLSPFTQTQILTVATLSTPFPLCPPHHCQLGLGSP